MNVFLLVFLFILGAVLGSFVCCQVQRMRLMEKKKKKLGKRSVCLSCGYQLRWYDNIPIVSWILLRGTCRKCGKKIGLAEFLSELLMGISFVMIGLSFGDLTLLVWTDWIYLVCVLIFVVILGFLAIYDGKWGELPQKILVLSVIFGVILYTVKMINTFLIGNSVNLESALLSLFGGIGILAGVYFLLYFFSKGKLVGDGDWILGLAISLCLGEWWLSLITISLANILALCVILPDVKIKKNKKIFFGPWMIFAFTLVFIFREFFSSLMAF